jgi:hypothetical protein
MVERDIFLEYDDDMFNRRRGGRVIVGEGACTRDPEGQAETKPRVVGKRIVIAS